MAGAALLGTTTLVVADLAVPSTASAAPISENFAGYLSGIGYAPFTVAPGISQPSTVQPGGTYTMTVSASTVTVPTTIAGSPVNYITNLQYMFPVPAGAAFRYGLSNHLHWSSPAPTPTTATYTERYCTANSGTTCTAIGTVLDLPRAHLGPLHPGLHRCQPHQRWGHAPAPGMACHLRR